MLLTVTLDQEAARERILMAANQHRIFNSTKIMTMRHIHRAVFRCRQHKLASTQPGRGSVMRKYILIIAFVLLAIFGLSACNVGPRQYCFNEPTVGPDGRAVNHIECVSTAYPGRG